MNSIMVSTGDGKQLLHLESILRVQSLDNYSKIFFTNCRPLVVSKVLLWFEERLPPESFSRIHRSHIINMDHVTNVSAYGNDCVQLRNGERISISRRRKATVVGRLKARQKIKSNPRGFTFF